jgi:streptogramin lyase
MRRLILVLLAGVALGGAACSSANEPAIAASGQSGLTGVVTSTKEGAMEGVLVSAKLGTVTTTVVTNKEGRYVFPPGRLAPGRYEMKIRAIGYDLADTAPVDIPASGSASRNLTLVETKDQAKQMMNAEWMASWPGTDADKQFAINCNHCHSFEITAKTGYKAEDWVRVLDRMNYANGASIQHPFRNPYHPEYQKYWGEYASQVPQTTLPKGSDEEGTVAVSPQRAKQSAYLASINLSQDPRPGAWKYELQKYARPTRDETRVIMTQYDLPRSESQPHDAMVDPDGMVWYLDFNNNYFGRLDPRTGQVKEWEIPAVKPFPPFGPGGLDVKIDPEGNPWFAMMRQNVIIKFDKKTEKMTMWHTPKEQNTIHNRITMLTTPTADGKVWWVTVGSSPTAWVHGLDQKTGEIKSIHVPAFIYGLEATPDGNLVFFSLAGGVVGEVDTKTGKTTLFKPPTPNSGPRRGEVDSEGRVWFAEFRAGNIGLLDRKSGSIKEWPLGVRYADPYDVDIDKHGNVWTAGMLTDYVFKLNPSTGTVTKYLAPTVNMNVRRIVVDKADKPSVWIGENHHGRILKVEPLE